MVEPVDTVTLQPDWLDRAADLIPGDELIGVRRKRPEFVDGTEKCRASVMTPKVDAGFGTALRAAFAMRVARQNLEPKLADMYRVELTDKGMTRLEQAIADCASYSSFDAPFDTLVRHCDLVSRSPARATADDIQKLASAGMNEQQIVALSEIFGFVNFEVRVAKGIRAIRQSTGKPLSVDFGLQSAGQTADGDLSIRLKPRRWIPHIAPVEIAQATEEQLEAMQVTPSSGKVSPYVRTLAHDPESYRARTELFNAIMYVKGGLRMQDRELGALAASIKNGCDYCAVVHAERQAHHAGSGATVYALYTGREDLLAPRDWMIVDFARCLSITPSHISIDHIPALYGLGLDTFEIIDLIHAIAIFGWANRLMHILGHSVPVTG